MSAVAVAACLCAPTTASAANPRVAALQVALRAHGVYGGPVDGLAGPGTSAGVRRLQARAGLAVDGIVGPRTRRALGPLGRHAVGSRALRTGHRGWDVAALQFALETRGFPCGPVDGGFGARTEAAVRRAQAFAGLRADGVAGPATPSTVSPAKACARRTAASVRAPKPPSTLPQGKPRVSSANCSAATSQPRCPWRSGRLPIGCRPWRPSALRVRGPTMPSTASPARAWMRRTPAVVAGPAIPSTAPP